MKKLIKLLLVLFPVMVIGQTQTENYIKTVTYKVASQEPIVTPTITQATQSVTYFDGLGRPIQQIVNQQSKSGNDIITTIKYDGFGRQVEEYLPFKSSSTNMAFDISAEANVLSYYGSPNPTVNGNPSQEATGNPFSRKELESSPLNRILKQAAPGNDWKSGSGHEIKMDYQSNGSEEVKLFTANTSWNQAAGLYSISLSNNGYYSPNQLYKTITYDENTAATPTETDGSTVEFKNKEGQVILKRTYATVGNGTTNQRHDTYYVYDTYGNLTYVIPPKAVDLIGSTTTVQPDVTSTTVVSPGTSLNLTATNSIILLPGFHAQVGSTFSAIIDNGTQGVLDILCYQYKYDYRNRLVEKKLPGKQWEFIVYDKLDRPVATGPANSPFSDIPSTGWLITKYDAFSRPVYTGWMSSTAATTDGRATLQAAQNNPDLSTINEAKQTSGSLDGIATYYSNVVAPTSFKLLTVNYYDNYTFPSSPAIVIPASVEGQSTLTADQVKGMATASWTRILSTSAATSGETTATFYDAKARPVRSYTQNYLGGYSYADNSLDAFSGQLLYTITKHKRTASDTELTTKDAFTYSPQDRLMTQTHQINGGAIEVIANNTYDELGQLISKQVGNNTQNINYTYNIRGWMTGINDISSLTKAGDPSDLFAFQINYNNPIPGGTALYNGNISQTHWKSSNSQNILRTYNYSYDRLNRLNNADFRNNTTTAENSSYFEKLQYDKNGNITFLHRSGDVVSQANLEWMDYMTYSYQGNQLNRVKEEGNNYFGFTTQIAQTNTANQYSYDANGNMISDANKNITAITYNHLNLPTKITFATTGNIVYIYNASGQKVQKIVTNGANTTTTDYLGGYQYENNQLQFFPQPEGYVNNNSGTYEYIYQYKDHLGNIRLSYNKNLNIVEENNYYPFGLKQFGYNNNSSSLGNAAAKKYKFSGKELQEEMGLNMTAMDYRQYDNALGRFNSIDRLTEFAYSISPYRFAYNNPVYYNDPSGLYEQGLSGWVNTGTTVFWDPNVNNQNDVDKLYNGQNYNYLMDDTVILDSDGDQRKLNGDGTVTTILNEVVISSSNKKKSHSPFSIVEGFSIWGSNRYGDLEGQKGHSKYSIEASDIPAIGGSAHSVNGQLSFWKRLFMLCKLGVDVELRAETIQSLNKTTMEVNNTEPVEPPMIDMQIQNYSAIDPIRGNPSQIHTGVPKDTSVVPSDSAMINTLNKRNYKAKMQEVERKNIIYKQNH